MRVTGSGISDSDNFGQGDQLERSVVVVGAGVIGSTCAFQLARAGFKVTIVDPLPPGQGCSFGNAGLIAIDHLVPFSSIGTLLSAPRMLFSQNGPLTVNLRHALGMLGWFAGFVHAAFGARDGTAEENLASLVNNARDAWTRLNATGLLDGLFRDIGTLCIHERDLSDRARLATDALLTRNNVDSTTLSAVEIAHLLPQLKTQVSHGRLFPKMASVASPVGIVEKIASAAAGLGVTFIRGEASEIVADPDGNITVKCGDQSVLASSTVLCAGVQTAGILRRMGHPIPLTRERGFHVELNHPEPGYLPFPLVFVDRGFAANPMRTGIRLAGTVELGVDDDPSWYRANTLAAQFGLLFRLGNTVSVASRWYGDRPTLPDYLPMIGPLPDLPSVIVATGHQHLGLTLAPLTAELVTQLVSRTETAINLRPFAVGRFGTHRK